jgi:predicted transcriptional regulator
VFWPKNATKAVLALLENAFTDTKDDDDSADWASGTAMAEQPQRHPASTAVEEVMSYAMLCLDRSTRMHRAAAHALATRARRVVVVDRHHVCGVISGMDFARALRAR